MRARAGATVLRVDGGMVASDWTMQFLADALDAPVDRPKILETTALGAAYLAGLQAGFYPPPAEFAKGWRLDRRFVPRMDPRSRAEKYEGWKDAVRRTLSAKTPERPQPAHRRRHEAERGKSIGDAGKQRRPQTHRHERHDGFAAFRETADIVDALARKICRLEAAALEEQRG